ncbi:MAG: PDZ domain-containing protein [Propionibacteriaceae bacterium]|nr:PDZ domain-containing protein [Propionibacteriaceae bacterium]
MTRQTWTATVSAVLFVLLAAVIALVPVPYVTQSPGSTYDLLGKIGDKDAITITGADTYQTTGQLRMTTVSVTAPTASLSLPEVLISYWITSRAVLPREAVYQPGATAEDVTQHASQLMVASQQTATVAGLRAAGIEVQKLPMVTAVQQSGPSAGVLQPGDLITEVDGEAVKTPEEVAKSVADRHVGTKVVFTVLRDGKLSKQQVTTRSSAARPDDPAVGITVDVGYRYAPQITFGIDDAVGGSSAGLMFALAIYDRLTTADLATGRVVAGTGTVTSDGAVGAIGGVQEKLAAASRDHATVFLLPKDNCSGVREVPAGMRLVSVATVSEAVAALHSLDDPATQAGVPGC